jgi:Na+-transporting NADH:ubiquinone oxidoreductase subunit NqrC
MYLKQMNRKTFFQSLLGGIGLGIAAKDVKADNEIIIEEWQEKDGRLVKNEVVLDIDKFMETIKKLKESQSRIRKVVFDEKGREFTFSDGKLVRSFTRGGIVGS